MPGWSRLPRAADKSSSECSRSSGKALGAAAAAAVSIASTKLRVPGSRFVASTVGSCNADPGPCKARG